MRLEVLREARRKLGRVDPPRAERWFVPGSNRRDAHELESGIQYAVGTLRRVTLDPAAARLSSLLSVQSGTGKPVRGDRLRPSNIGDRRLNRSTGPDDTDAHADAASFLRCLWRHPLPTH